MLLRLYSPGPGPCVGHVVSYVAASECQSVARDSAVRSSALWVSVRTSAIHQCTRGNWAAIISANNSESLF